MQIDTAAKQLMFSTVRITTIATDGGVSFGTGFLMDIDPKPGFQTPVLITNKHVVAGADVMQFAFTKQQPNADQPILGETHMVTITEAAAAWTGHPDPTIDVTVMPLATVISQATEPLFYRLLPITLFPTPEVAETLDALEEITFVGYPNGYQDDQHKTPIFRRGITATPVALPFSGRPVFLVDGSVFGGSSGSPALILNEGSYKHGNGIAIGSRLLLVGIIAETMVRETVLPLQVSAAPYMRLSQELNLGVVFNWAAIDGAIDELFRRMGTVRPAPPELA